MYIICGAKAYSKTGLFRWLEEVVTTRNDSQKQHVDLPQKGNRSLVLQESGVVFLVEQDHHTSAPRLRCSANVGDGIIKILKDFKRTQKLSRDTRVSKGNYVITDQIHKGTGRNIRFHAQ
ncbi:unnamed protein product [Parnassius mnemosyne]|uniref:Uncharacterized protein n=1 Tax=Parnassius mnemosyne TaxID=213953 RepID=A0AAV1LX45_9NEOP